MSLTTSSSSASLFFFFFNDTATTEIYTLSLHDALPISVAHRVRAEVHRRELHGGDGAGVALARAREHVRAVGDRKSTRLNSSHLVISYAVFCLKKKKESNIVFVSTSSSSKRPLATLRII